jgi:putative transcriptional regulator
MRWNLRLRAAEKGIWKSNEMRRLLAHAGLEISSGKMSGLWTGTPTTIRLDDLDVICTVLDCSPAELLICEPERVQAQRPQRVEAVGEQAAAPVVRLGRQRSTPPA